MRKGQKQSFGKAKQSRQMIPALTFGPLPPSRFRAFLSVPCEIFSRPFVQDAAFLGGQAAETVARNFFQDRVDLAR